MRTAEEVLKGFTAFQPAERPFINIRKTTVTFSVSALEGLGEPKQIQMYTNGSLVAFQKVEKGTKMSTVNNRYCRFTNGNGEIDKLLEMSGGLEGRFYGRVEAGILIVDMAK